MPKELLFLRVFRDSTKERAVAVYSTQAARDADAAKFKKIHLFSVDISFDITDPMLTKCSVDYDHTMPLPDELLRPFEEHRLMMLRLMAAFTSGK